MHNLTQATKTKYGTQPFYDAIHDAGYDARSFAKECGRSVTIGHVREVMHGRAVPSLALRRRIAEIFKISDMEKFFTKAVLREEAPERDGKPHRVYFEAEVN